MFYGYHYHYMSQAHYFATANSVVMIKIMIKCKENQIYLLARSKIGIKTKLVTV